jgi:Leucine-rich repeat (LRR) protein/Ca2+-binding EF-hand superfamily protein
MPIYRTMKQGILKGAQKPNTGMGGSGRVEILRCVKGLKKGMAEWYIKFIDLTVVNKYQADLMVYITKRRVKKRQRGVELRDYRVLLDVGNGGRAKGPGIKGTFVQPLFNVPLERDITGVFIAKPQSVRPITSDTQIHLWCELQNKSDRDPAEWYPVLHEHRKTLEDMFIERANSTTALDMGGNSRQATEKKLKWLKENAKKAFDRFDADKSGAVDYGEYIRMLRYLQLFLLPCDSRRIFQNCDMDDTGELDSDQFEVALYVIMTIQEHQQKAAEQAAAAMHRPGTTDTGSSSSGRGGSDKDHQPTMRLQPHEAFESFDGDRDGLLDQLEFNEALRSLGVVQSAPRDPLSQEADLQRLMDTLLEEVSDGTQDETRDKEDPTRLVSFAQFLHGWVSCCNVNYEIKSRNIHLIPGQKPKDLLLNHIALAAKRQSELMAHSRSQGWEMKRLARINSERTRRIKEKQAEKESSDARKDLALKEKSDRLAGKAASMQHFEAERRLKEYAREAKKAQKLRISEELNEKHEIMVNRIKERDLLASRMGWDLIDYSDMGLLQIPETIYWFRQEKKSKDEESKDLSSVLMFDLSHNRLEEMPNNSFWFRADKLQVLTLDYNQFQSIPSGISDCRDLLSVTISQNLLEGTSILGQSTALNGLHNLVNLDLSGNKIQKWPNNGFQASTTGSLEILNLANNELEVIPGVECLSTFSQLIRLNLSNNKIYALGSDGGLGNLTCLQVLNLSGNILESLPEDLGCIGSTLLSINLSNNNLRWLPSTLNELHGLRLLDVSRNQLTTLPNSIIGLKDLVEINGGRNKIAMIPETFGSLLKLEIINFQHNNLRTLPETIGLLTRLQQIDLRNNRLIDLPREMGSWILLRELDVRSNKIQTLPASCGHCHRLKSLNMHNNSIECIPHTVSTLIHLEIFDLGQNQLKSLSAGIGKATSLLKLDLGGNVNLHSLPRTIGHLGKLKQLNLSSCGISKLPNDLVKCTALQSLWLRHNRLEALPIELVEQIPTLYEFDVTGNPLRKLPEKWSGMKRKYVSGTGYTSRDASEYIARQSRVHPIAVQVWEKMMKECLDWKPPTSPKMRPDLDRRRAEQKEEGTLKEQKEEAQAKEEHEQEDEHEQEHEQKHGQKHEKEQEQPESSSQQTTNEIVIHTAGSMKSDGRDVYKLPITLTAFMKNLKDELGVRWDDHARETSIRFFKQARLLYGRTPRYDQLDEDDFEKEEYAKEMARRKIEDKVVWSHRDHIRAEELRQQAYESQLDSLGLKILNRRLRRDYAERKRKKKYNDAKMLNERMKEELIKQETRTEMIRLKKEVQEHREKQELMEKIREKMKKYNIVKTKAPKGFVISLDDVEEIPSTDMLDMEDGDGQDELVLGGGDEEFYYEEEDSVQEGPSYHRRSLESAESTLLDADDLLKMGDI